MSRNQTTASQRSDRSIFDGCAYCRTAFETDVSYPVVARQNGTEELELYSFCDECCEAAWRMEH